VEALVQHLLNAGLQTGQQRSDVLNQDVIQSLGQVVQATVSCHAAVLWMCTEEVQLCSPGLPYVPATDDVLLTAIHHPCKGDLCVQLCIWQDWLDGLGWHDAMQVTATIHQLKVVTARQV